MADESFDFRSWIRRQPHRGYEADLADDDHFVLTTEYATAQINFYDMEPDPEIVEFHIENKADGSVKFFLHFHAEERDHAIQLFREMVQTLVSLREQQVTEVLLCCTVGMTTTFFAERLNQVAEAMELDWHFSAVAVSEAFEHGRDKAAVLVAPQIGYQAERMQMSLPEVPVLAIPTAIFASYDAAGCVEWLREELRARRRTTEERALEHVAHGLVNDKRIFAVAVHAAPEKVTIQYRLYDRGEVVLDRMAIKRRLSLADITDVLDTQVCRCKGGGDADAVGIGITGSIHDGLLDVSRSATFDLTDGTEDFNLGAYLNKRYRIPIFLCNNANAAALGWYVSQDQFRNVTFYSQASGWAVGGQGHVVDGRLVEGAHGNAGEIKYVVQRFNFSHPLHYNAYDPADVLELAAQVLAMDCATFDPEVVALRCELLPDMEEVAEELARYIPRAYQPKLVHVDNYNECILLGMMVYSLQQLTAAG